MLCAWQKSGDGLSSLCSQPLPKIQRTPHLRLAKYSKVLGAALKPWRTSRILFTEAPLADAGDMVSAFLKNLKKGCVLGSKSHITPILIVISSDIRMAHVQSRHESATTRGTHGFAAVSIREVHPRFEQRVNVRC